MTKPRLLFTGSTGFVGRAVIPILQEAGYAIRHVIREGTQNRIRSLEPHDEIITTRDLFSESPSWWAETATGCDIVLHMAWYAEPGHYQLSQKNFDCLSGTLQMCHGIIQAKVPRFVGIGTCLEYDLSDGYVHTDTPLNPQSPYAAAKAACAIALSQMLPSAGIGFLWARLFYLYGPEEDERRLTAYLHHQLKTGQPAKLSDATQIRDFLEISEAARLLVQDITSNKTGATNISSGSGISVRTLAERIADDYGRRDLLHFGARPNHPDDPPIVVGLRDTS